MLITWRRERGDYFASDNDSVHIFRSTSSASLPWVLVTPQGCYDYETLREAKQAYTDKRTDEARLGYWPADPRKNEVHIDDAPIGAHVTTPAVHREGAALGGMPARPRGGGPLVHVAASTVELPDLPGRWHVLVCRARNGATWREYVSVARPVVALARSGRVVDGVDLTPPSDIPA